MPRILSIFAVLVTSGCIVPKHTHTRRTIAHTVEPLKEALPTALVVNVDASNVRVTALRICRGQAYDLVVDTLHVKPVVIGADVTPRRPDEVERPTEQGEGAAALAAVSGLLTLAYIAAVDGKIEVRRERRRDEELPCPMALRQVVVDVDLVSGLKLTGRTDDTGVAEFVIPASEPAAGTLTVRAPGMAPRIVEYSRGDQQP